jgi:DNA-binding MarR family transcriptional regulator
MALLITAAYVGMVDRLLEAMAAAGLTEMRQAYGFVIREVAAESPTVTRLAEALDVSKQAASKLVDEMEEKGFIERTPDPVDRRALRLELTAKGKKVLRTALATSSRVERALQVEIGKPGVRAFRRALMAFLRQNGGVDDVLARRVKSRWS